MIVNGKFDGKTSERHKLKERLKLTRLERCWRNNLGPLSTRNELSGLLLVMFWHQGCQIGPDFPPNLAILAAVRCSDGSCKSGPIWQPWFWHQKCDVMRLSKRRSYLNVVAYFNMETQHPLVTGDGAAVNIHLHSLIWPTDAASWLAGVGRDPPLWLATSALMTADVKCPWPVLFTT